MSYEKLGFVSGQTLKAEHLNHMEDGIANISWNDLKDKPFYSEVIEGIPEFDGDLTGKECVDYGDGISMVKITETQVTFEQLIGSTVVVKAPDGYDDITLEITEDMIHVNAVTETTGVMTVYNHSGMPLMFVAYGDVAANGAPFSDGTYFMHQLVNDSAAYTRSLSYLNGIHKIDEKYLPESVKSKGATVYYYAGRHLYHDQWENQVTKEELRAAYQLGAIYIYDNYTGGVADLHLALNVHIDDTEGYVSFIEANDTEWQTLYTAEHETLPPS